MIEPIRELDGTWEEVRAHDAELAGRRVRLNVLPGANERQNPSAPSARELMAIPADQRDRILEQQAALAERLYTTIPELTAFEAYGEEDLFDDTPER